MKKIEFNLNGEPVSIETNGLKRLVDVLREDFQLTGTKEGCGEGECGACSIFLNGSLVNSCLVALEAVAGKNVVTIEGFRKTERYRVLEQAYADAGAVQCGFCTPGMILASEALLSLNPSPSETAIRAGLSGNLCRCTGYNMIVEAVLLAAKRGAHLWQ